MKKIISAILIIVLAFAFSISAFAAADYKVTSDPMKVVIDGVVNKDEWGEPIFKATPDEVLALQSKGWDFWSFVPAPAGQYVEFYITNDTDYIYVAGKMVNAQKDMGCETPDTLWQHPHMVVTFGSYVEGIVCPKIEYQGDQYELYTCYSLGFVAQKPYTVCTSQGMTTTELSEGDYSVTYDEAEKTYHYEMRIPLNVTSLDIWNNDTICLGLDFTDAHTGGDAGNRYLISKAGERGMAWFGPNNFHFQYSNPLIIKLNDVMSLRGDLFIPEKTIITSEIEPLSEDYYKNYELMSVSATCSAIAAVFAAAAAIVVLIKKKK